MKTFAFGKLAVTAVAALVAGLATQAVAGDSCFYKGSMYSDGAAACQAGSQFRCHDGDWRAAGVTCQEDAKAPAKNCEIGGISYSTGSASCQAGTQHRCEDGVWRTLGVACTVGDAPIRAVPGAKTCMFNDATVASNSTICKSGTTFLCSDGDWVNLGTMCR